jgi:uncharacterized membrane protein YbjE (DUF340 family)
MELSPEEKRHIKKLSIIPAAIIVYVFIGCFIFSIRGNQYFQLSYYVAYFIVAFMLAMPAALFLTEEILYARKSKRPFAYYMRRFLEKMSITVLGAILLGIILGTANFSLSPLIGENNALILGFILWFVVWGALVVHFRKWFGKLSNDNL